MHEESSHINLRLQDQLMERGKNLIVDTVLKDEQSADKISARLDAKGYHYRVVSVQTDYETSAQSVMTRWAGVPRACGDGPSCDACSRAFSGTTAK